MRFLKTLRRADLEHRRQANSVDSNDQTDRIVELEPNRPAGILADREMRIGKPVLPVELRRDDVVEDRDPITDEFIQNIPINRPVEVPREIERPVVRFKVEPITVNPHVVAITDPQSIYAEEFRVLRTQIIHRSHKETIRSIVVSSVGPGEGKSITALNLAWLLAQSDGIKALVIDADLRMPSLARYLSVNPKVGLSHILTGKSTLATSVICLEPAGLHFLPSGKTRDDVGELLSGSAFREILEEAHRTYDFVVIDTPPLGLFSDAALMANAADSSLLVIRTNQVRYKDIDRILETFPKDKIIGSVLNDSDESLLNSGYYGYSYYKKSGDS